MTKASRLTEELMNAPPLTPEEIEKRYGPRPALRLSERAIANGATPGDAGQAFERVSGDAPSAPVVVRDPDSGRTAVMLSAEQYLELVTSNIRDRRLLEAGLDGRIGPSGETLSGFGVEQVDPQATWM